MRMIVFFDLPVKTKNERKEATKFRNFLIKNGFYMIQFSVYVKTCKGYDSVETHKNRIRSNLPKNGCIRLMIITEKQYQQIDILLGNLKSEDKHIKQEQLSFF